MFPFWRLMSLVGGGQGMVGLDLRGRAILVTGAAGFIGFHVSNRLLADGAQVIGLDNMNAYYDVSLKEARLRQLMRWPGFRFERLDIAESGPVHSLFASHKPVFVIHLAAQAGVRYSLVNPHAYVRSNIAGFVTILEACRTYPVRHLVYASSSSVYGANTKVPFHEDDPVNSPVSLYAATKRADELMAETYAHLFAVPASGLRFFTVYGPWGRPDMAYFSFTEACFEGRRIDVYNGGRMQRDFTYIDDAIEAVSRLLVRPPTSAAETLGLQIRSPHIIYNVGNHTSVELSVFVATIEAAVGRSLARRNAPMQPGDLPTTFADVKRLARVTGFAPRTPLVEGISRFVAWYRQYKRRENLSGGSTCAIVP
jgi:UDP-glucuronate 4-epimerase